MNYYDRLSDEEQDAIEELGEAAYNYGAGTDPEPERLARYVAARERIAMLMVTRDNG